MTHAPVSARAVRGKLRLCAEADANGRTLLRYRHAAGAYHLSKPYWDGHALMVQWINPTAGIFAGDVLSCEVNVEAGAALLLATPSATRIHTRTDAAHPPGLQEQLFHVASGGFLEVQSEWLIPQRGSAFKQRTAINLHAGAGLFYTELLAPGRVAHGEALDFDQLDLRLSLRVHDRLVLQERLHATHDQHWMLQDAQGCALFVATALVSIPDQGEAMLKPIRGVMEAVEGCSAGASMIDEHLFAIRLASKRGIMIKKALNHLRRVVAEHSHELRGSLRRL